MRRRLLEALAVASVMIALIVFLRLSVAGQAAVPQSTARTPVAPATPSAIPKTAWGHPSLEGIWLDEFDTPLERPAKYATREFFTDEERTAQDAERSGNAGRNQRAEVGSRQDVAGAYNAVFTSAKPTGRRTSLVVDPPNGRIPALTARAQELNRRDREFRLALLQNTDTCKNKMTACTGWQVRAAIAALVRSAPVLQHAAHEPPRRPRGSEHGRSLHVWDRSRTSSDSAASYRDRTRLRSASTPGRARDSSGSSI